MPDEYRLRLERAAERALSRLTGRTHGRIEQAIDALAVEPRPRGVIKLEGSAPLYRLRVGDYRIIYAVFDVERIVIITDVSRRTTQTYRRLP